MERLTNRPEQLSTRRKNTSGKNIPPPERLKKEPIRPTLKPKDRRLKLKLALALTFNLVAGIGYYGRLAAPGAAAGIRSNDDLGTRLADLADFANRLGDGDLILGRDIIGRLIPRGVGERLIANYSSYKPEAEFGLIGEAVGDAKTVYSFDEEAVYRVAFAVMGNETPDFNVGSVSSAGAIGPMQMMPDTARALRDGLSTSESGRKIIKKYAIDGKVNLSDRRVNYFLGVLKISQDWSQINGIAPQLNKETKMDLLAASHFAGSDVVIKAIKLELIKNPSVDFAKITYEDIANTWRGNGGLWIGPLTDGYVREARGFRIADERIMKKQDQYAAVDIDWGMLYPRLRGYVRKMVVSGAPVDDDASKVAMDIIISKYAGEMGRAARGEAAGAY